MLDWVNKKFDSSNVFLAEIEFSDSINRSWGHYDYRPTKLQPHIFKIDTNNPTAIFWRENTANNMLRDLLNLVKLDFPEGHVYPCYNFSRNILIYQLTF